MNKVKAFSIHKATTSDAPAIARMVQALAAYEGEASAADEASIQAMLEGCAPECHCLIAKVTHPGQPKAEPGSCEIPGRFTSGMCVGFALYYAGYDLSSASYGFHLADLYVDEAHRKHGIATQLLAAIAEQALSEHRAWISLTALKSNASAAAFYNAKAFHKADVDFYAIGANGMRRLVAKA